MSRTDDVPTGSGMFAVRFWVEEIWGSVPTEREGYSLVVSACVLTNDFSARFGCSKNVPTLPRCSTSAEPATNFLPCSLFRSSMFGLSRRSTRLGSCCCAQLAETHRQIRQIVRNQRTPLKLVKRRFACKANYRQQMIPTGEEEPAVLLDLASGA